VSLDSALMLSYVGIFIFWFWIGVSSVKNVVGSGRSVGRGDQRVVQEHSFTYLTLILRKVDFFIYILNEFQGKTGPLTKKFDEKHIHESKFRRGKSSLNGFINGLVLDIHDSVHILSEM